MKLKVTSNNLFAFLGVIALHLIRVKSEKEIQAERKERRYKTTVEKKKRLLDIKMYEVDIMNGKEFEEFLECYFQQLGYAVKLTSDTQDYGADLILYKNGIKVVVQAKRRTNKVGNIAVQEVGSAIKHYQADKGMVITNTYFTRNAYHLAESNEIELWDRKKLIDFMRRVRNSNPPRE